MTIGHRLLARIIGSAKPKEDIFEMRLKALQTPWPLRQRAAGGLFRNRLSHRAA